MLMITNIEAQMGIYLTEKDLVILNSSAFWPYFKIRDAPKIKF